MVISIVLKLQEEGEIQGGEAFLYAKQKQTFVLAPPTSIYHIPYTFRRGVGGWHKKLKKMQKVAEQFKSEEGGKIRKKKRKSDNVTISPLTFSPCCRAFSPAWVDIRNKDFEEVKKK